MGDVIALSVATPKHLRVMGLLEDGPDDLESNINQLYKMVRSILYPILWYIRSKIITLRGAIETDLYYY